MKSHIPINRKMQEELCRNVWEDVTNCINSNGMLMIIALARLTGWKKKRMEKFIELNNEVQKEFRQYELDGVFNIMAERELEEIGLEKDQLLPKPIDFMKERRTQRREKEKHDAPVSSAKAEELQRQLGQYGRFSESRKEKETNNV